MGQKILFVCLGNICRSPAAEGVARVLGSAHVLDSAGLGDWHTGEAPHRVMQEVAAERGFPIGDLRARQVRPEDFSLFDLIVGMDSQNMEGLKALHARHGGRAELRKLCTGDVPDPYYGGREGFYDSFDMIRLGVEELLAGLPLRAR